MMIKKNLLAIQDPEINQVIQHELKRQEDHIELIASENYASYGVLEAQGSILTNKYAEGYPSKRYYGGCEYVDIAEELAINRAKKLFNAKYVNVQPHSGSQANAAVMMALLKPNDAILGMSLSHGGHLTHGSRVNFSGKIYNSYEYGVDHNGFIDYDDLAKKAKEIKPKMIIAGFSAYSQILDWQKFRDIANEVNALLLADIAHIAGLVATGLYPSPMNYADVVTTTTHKTLRGPRGGMILANTSEEIEKKLQSSVFPGNQGGPLMHVIAAKAVAFAEALLPEFRNYQKQVLKNADVMAKSLINRGFNIVSGGTKNHLMLVNLIGKNITGKAADKLLGEANITVNKNTVPQDPESPFVTSGLRLGTPAITTRGFKETEVIMVANWIADLLEEPNNLDKLHNIKLKVIELCKQFPVYE